MPKRLSQPGGWCTIACFQFGFTFTAAARLENRFAYSHPCTAFRDEGRDILPSLNTRGIPRLYTFST